MAYNPEPPPFDTTTAKLGENFLLMGTDAWLIDSYLRRIRETLSGTQDLDSVLIYADEVRGGVLEEHLDTFTIFSSAKLLVIKNCEKFPKRELEIIASYFEAPSEIQTLIIVTEKTDAKFNYWKKIKDNCKIIPCNPPKFASEIRNWLMNELKLRGKLMAPKAIVEFTSRTELDYLSVANELEKVLLLIGDRKQINESDVLTSLSGSRAGTQIDFLRALGNRQCKNALESIALMLETDTEPLRIFFGISRFFMILYKILLLREQHVSDMEINQKHLTEVFISQRKEYLNFSRKYDVKNLENIFEILLDTEYKLKSSVMDKTMALELCIIQALSSK